MTVPPLSRLVTRHPALLAVAGSCLLCVVLSVLLGADLQNWIVALGMDDDRAGLCATTLLVAVTALASALVTPRRLPVRGGSVLGFLLVGVVPFFVRAATTPPTPGLQASLQVSGWVFEAVGFVLLGIVAATVGAGAGALVRNDLARFASWLRARPWRIPPLLPLAAVVLLSAATVVEAFQESPMSQLYTYGSAHSAAAGADPYTVALSTPGRVINEEIAGRQVVVYVPGAYAALRAARFPVVYFLHGSPASPGSWTNGVQLPGVLDQLIAARAVPPLIAVMPNGNGPHGRDTEWGGGVETWLVDDVVPTIDAQLRTAGAAWRGIAGFSSGGFGAVNLAVRHPTVFRWAASYSGYFTARRDIFGKNWASNSPVLTVRQLPALLRMPLFIGAGARDRGYLTASQQFVAELKRLGWPQLDVDVVAAGHSSEAWRTEVVDSLRWLGGAWHAPPVQVAVAGPALTRDR